MKDTVIIPKRFFKKIEKKGGPDKIRISAAKEKKYDSDDGRKKTNKANEQERSKKKEDMSDVESVHSDNMSVYSDKSDSKKHKHKSKKKV